MRRLITLLLCVVLMTPFVTESFDSTVEVCAQSQSKKKKQKKSSSSSKKSSKKSSSKSKSSKKSSKDDGIDLGDIINIAGKLLK